MFDSDNNSELVEGVLEVTDGHVEIDASAIDGEGPTDATVAFTKFLLAIVVAAAILIRRTTTFRNAIIFVVISTLCVFTRDY